MDDLGQPNEGLANDGLFHDQTLLGRGRRKTAVVGVRRRRAVEIDRRQRQFDGRRRGFRGTGSHALPGRPSGGKALDRRDQLLDEIVHAEYDTRFQRSSARGGKNGVHST